MSELEWFDQFSTKNYDIYCEYSERKIKACI